VDEHKLRSIYNEFQKKINKNNEKFNEFLKYVPEQIANNLKYQEHKLSTFEAEEKKFQRLAKFLSKRSNKKLDDLLINKTDDSRLKKEIAEIIENNKSFEERFGNYSWNMSLRRPKNFVGTRFALINVGSPNNPMWVNKKDVSPYNMEMIRKPNHKKEEMIRSLSNNRYFMQTIDPASTLELSKLDNLKDVGVEGQNLLKVEMENAQNLTGKKIVYKKDYLASLSGPINNGVLNTNSSGGFPTNEEFNKAHNKKLTGPQNYASHYNVIDFCKRPHKSKSVDFKNNFH
jgi:hypothetical protein